MLEVVFSCPLCSRMFLRDCPYAEPMPHHLDPLLGLPCAGSGTAIASLLELAAAGHEHASLRWERAAEAAET